jgi:4-amino-4-deoxy-L-arabinose transferase-like glycosyltransferase
MSPLSATPSQNSTPLKTTFYLKLMLGLFFILRLISLGTAPLFDTTETRYANIAQQLILRQDWLVPYMPLVHKAFLGKPPLTFWLIGVCYELFGCTDWSSRIPNFLEGVLTVVFTALIAKQITQQSGVKTNHLAPLILASSGLFFALSATVSMDMLVCLTVTASIWAYLNIKQAQVENAPKAVFGYETILALVSTVGFMNKGPISLILFIGPLVLLALWQRRWQPLQLRWWWVLLVTLGINAPWFIAVQQKQPWFLQYFFINEHLLRFISPNYGDLYGSGHHFPYGTIWLYLLGGFLPWTPFLIIPFLGNSITHFKGLWHRLNTQITPTTQLLICWAVFAPLFFTMAKSIVITYILSSLPAMALLVGQLLAKQLEQPPVNSEAPQPAGFTTVETRRIAALLKWMPFLLALACLICLVYTVVSPSSLPTNTLALVGSTLVIGLFCVMSFWALRSQKPAAHWVQISLLALFPVLGVTIFYLFFSTALAYKKSMKPMLIALAKVRPDFAKQPTLFLEDAPTFSWFYYGQEALVNQQLQLEKQGQAKPLILPEYDITYTFPTEPAVFNHPIVVIVSKKVLPSLLNQQKKHAELSFKPLASEGYYAAYLVQHK